MRHVHLVKLEHVDRGDAAYLEKLDLDGALPRTDKNEVQNNLKKTVLHRLGFTALSAVILKRSYPTEAEHIDFFFGVWQDPTLVIQHQ